MISVAREAGVGAQSGVGRVAGSLPTIPVFHAALAFCACFVDVVCVVGLFHTFTAFITGSMVLLFVDMVDRPAGVALKLIVIGGFIFFSLGWYALIMRLPGPAARHLRLLLLIEALLLSAFMAVAWAGAPLPGPLARSTVAALLLSTAAMSLQTLITTRVLDRNIATTLMTGNAVRVLSGLHDSVFDRKSGAGSGDHRTVLPVILAFAGGGFTGALTMTTVGFPCLVIPVTVLLVLAARAPRVGPSA